MTDRNKFEEMLERLINEDRAGAEELFHEIVVEKSREIYQAIIESEDEEVDEAEDEEVEEAADEEELDESEDEEVDEAADDEELDEAEDEEVEEMFGLDEFELEADPMMGGDATDDMMGDVGMDDAGMDDMGGSDEPLTKADLDAALDQLMAEFQAMLGDEEGEEGDDMDMDMGDEEGEEDEEGDEEEADDDEEAKEEFAFEAKKADKKDDKKAEKKTAAEQMREYVEKVAPAKMGDNGANSKSIVASKNDMGGTAANILRADTEAGVEANKGHLKGSSVFKGTPKEDNAGNINVPGGKAGKTAFKKQEPGHGAEKKGKPETADKSAGSTIKGVVRKN